MIFEGEAIPVQNVTLSFPANGIVDEVSVTEGEQVSQGDVIARLKGLERQKASITAAQAELLSAQQTLDDLDKNANVTRADAQLNWHRQKKHWIKPSKTGITRTINARINGISTSRRQITTGTQRFQ